MANGTIAVPEKAAEVDFYKVKTKYKGILSWLLTTDHKRIGIMYLCSMAFFFLVAMSLGVVMRLEMLSPGSTFISAQT